MRLSYKKPPTWSKDKQGHLEMVPLTNLIMSSDSVWWRRYHPHGSQFSLCHPFFFPRHSQFSTFRSWIFPMYLDEMPDCFWVKKCCDRQDAGGMESSSISSRARVWWTNSSLSLGSQNLVELWKSICVYFICNILVILFKCMYIIFWKDG